MIITKKRESMIMLNESKNKLFSNLGGFCFVLCICLFVHVLICENAENVDTNN